MNKYDGWARPDKPAERQPPEVAPRGKNKTKDLKRFCRGNPRFPHDPVVAEDSLFATFPCTRLTWLDRTWACRHQEECSRCGKVMRNSWQLELSECPMWDGLPRRLPKGQQSRD